MSSLGLADFTVHFIVAGIVVVFSVCSPPHGVLWTQKSEHRSSKNPELSIRDTAAWAGIVYDNSQVSWKRDSVAKHHQSHGFRKDVLRVIYKVDRKQNSEPPLRDRVPRIQK